MTVTLISPPDGSTLASTTTPVILTATSPEVILVSRYPSGALFDVVYFAGAFAPAYASTSSLVGTQFSVVRTGGWPAALTISAYEPSANSGDTIPWRSLYELDLTAQPTQSITTPGSYTIDGKTWWVKGTVQAGQTLGLVNGSGLRDASDGTSDMLLASGASTVTQAVYFFPLDQLANFDPTAPIALQAVLTDAQATAPSVRPFVGLVSAAKSSAAWDTRTSQMLVSWSVVGGALPSANVVAAWGGSGGWSQTSTSSPVSSLTANTLTLLRSAAQLGVTGVDAYAGTYTNPISAGSLAGAVGLAAAAATTPGVIFGSTAPITQSCTGFLRGLKIWQPRVA